MTAELIVMNRNGLAMAADSAASISTGDRQAKVYNTSNKLFALSKHHPVGVMVYGSAEIMGLPWETVIKLFREKLGERSYGNLEGYASCFLAFLANDAFTSSCYDEYVKHSTYDVFEALTESVDSEVKRIIDAEGVIESEKIEEIHSREIKKYYDRFRRKRNKLDSDDRNGIAESMKNHRASVGALVGRLIENRPIKGTDRRRLVDSCLLAAIVLPGMSPSGVVIAGFGDADVFPSARAFEIEKVIDGYIDFTPVLEADIALDNPARIRAFAQSNETHNFMTGISEKIELFILSDMNRMLSNAFARQVADQLIVDGIVNPGLEEQCRDNLQYAAWGVHAYIKKQFSDICRKEFIAPVLDAVEFFTPTEMAGMAETLVNLESFRQQVTLRDETVGGPIDVAVITRGDGFVWVKRKHYFAAELNHQFFANYNRVKDAARENQVNGRVPGEDVEGERPI